MVMLFKLISCNYIVYLKCEIGVRDFWNTNEYEMEFYDLCILLSTVLILYWDWIGFCHTGPISLCVNLFAFICVCVCFVLHNCCIIVSTVVWT